MKQDVRLVKTSARLLQLVLVKNVEEDSESQLRSALTPNPWHARSSLQLTFADPLFLMYSTQQGSGGAEGEEEVGGVDEEEGAADDNDETSDSDNDDLTKPVATLQSVIDSEIEQARSTPKQYTTQQLTSPLCPLWARMRSGKTQVGGAK